MQNSPANSDTRCIRQGKRWSGHTFQPVHSSNIEHLSKFKAPDGKQYKYWAYFCVADGPGNYMADHFSTRLACTNDLNGAWEFFNDREILQGRWPTVYYDEVGKIFYMFYGDPFDECILRLATSTDGINWDVQKEPIIRHQEFPVRIDGGNNTFLWMDEKDKAFYLFYHDKPGVYHRIIYRKVSIGEPLENMRTAHGVIVLEDKNLVAAPSVYRDKAGELHLLVETYFDEVWRTASYDVTSFEEGPAEGYIKDTPIIKISNLLGDHAACAMPFYDGGDTRYVFYAVQQAEAKPMIDLWNIQMTTYQG